MSFRKDDLVKLNPETCFTVECGGGRAWPLSTIHEDEKGIVSGYRHPTEQELENWRNSSASQGIDCAGETKLPPICAYVKLHRDETYTVVRGRARKTCVWGNPEPGYTVIRRGDGEECFVKTSLLKIA